MTPIQSAATKAGIAAAVLAILLFRVRRSNRPPEWFGLRTPPLLASCGFIALYLGWMLATDAVLHWRGPWNFTPWQQAPLAASALRIVAVCLLGPAVEELLFRGAIFSWLKERIPTALVISVTAIGWALLHWSY